MNSSKMNPMKRYSIRQFVSFITLFPLIVLAIGLEFFFLRDRFSDLDADLIARGQFIARQLASGSEYGVFSNNQIYLQNIAHGALQQQDVRGAIILNAASETLFEERDYSTVSKKPVATEKPAMPGQSIPKLDMAQLPVQTRLTQAGNAKEFVSLQTPVRSSSESLWIYQPIIATQLSLDTPEFVLTAPQIGSVIVEISRAQTEQLKSKLLWYSITATAFFLGLILYLIHLASRHITRPTSLLSNAVQQIGQGNLEKRVTESSRIAELDILMHGINDMAAKLQKESSNLQHLIEERTSQVTQAKLTAEAAQSKAEHANAAKSKFLAAASHDLRQPIHAQGLFLGVLSRTELTQYQRVLLSSARAALDASGEMLNTLLDFSRIEAGVVKPQVQPFSLQPLFNKIENEFAPQADAKGLNYRSRETTLAVQSDPMLVELILRNLLSNAIRYTESGGVLVGCRRRGNLAVLEVWDTGIGIEPEHQEEVFREFHQLGNPERDSRKGLGLGLAISDGLARTLNHGLSLVSTPLRGSVFRLTLPIATVTLPVKEPAAAARGNTGTLNVRVLVIDDDEAVREAMLHLLRNWGCESKAVESIEEALAMARAFEPDVVVSDYRLREQRTGAEAIAALRTLLGNTIPALLITGDTAPERLREAQTSGIPLLHKPVSPSQLLYGLVEVLEGTALQAAAGFEALKQIKSGIPAARKL